MPRPKMKDVVVKPSGKNDTPLKSLGTVPDRSPKPPRKGYQGLPTKQGLGGMTYSDREMGELFAQPLTNKQQLGRNKWADTALVLAYRAKKAAQSYGKKDFNALYRLVLSGSIAYDKAFPQVQSLVAGNLVLQLFGSLGSEIARKILEPARPIIEVEGKEVPNGEPVVETTKGEIPSIEPLDDTT